MKTTNSFAGKSQDTALEAAKMTENCEFSRQDHLQYITGIQLNPELSRSIEGMASCHELNNDRVNK